MSNEAPNYRKPHVFDPIHNGADECECGLTVDADIHESDEAYEERMRPRILNPPERIWLQVGCDDEVGEIDWKELSHSDVSWCDEKIHNTDIEYVRATTPPAASSEGELHSVICSVIVRHCKDVQLPHGIRGLEDDLTAAILSRYFGNTQRIAGVSPASAAPGSPSPAHGGQLRITPEVAAKLVHLRDLLAQMESSELVNDAYHTLYSIADPAFESFYPWAELERLAALRTSVGEESKQDDSANADSQS